MKDTNLRNKIVEQFWLEKLKGVEFTPFLNLENSASTSEYQEEEIALSLPKETVVKLNEITRNNSVGKFIFFVAALRYTISQYTHNADVIITSPSIGNSDESIFFRSPIISDISILQFVNNVRDELSKNCAHLPSELSSIIKKFEELDQGDTAALYYISILYNKVADSAVIREKSNWLFDFIEDDKGISILIKHRDPCQSWLLHQFINHLSIVLGKFLDNAQYILGDVAVMSGSDIQTVLDKFNNVGDPYTLDKTFIQLFEDKVKEAPDSIALEFKEIRITYDDFNKQANKLSHYLIDHHNVQTGDQIGLMIERSEWLIIAFIGILKSGAIVVPVDIIYPTERKKRMLNDSTAKVLITESKHLSDVEWNGLSEDIHDCMSASLKETNLEVQIDNNDLAYLVYTSGSTGQPKGILQTHKCLASVALNLIKYEKFPDRQRVLQFASIGFDVSIGMEINFAFLSGGTLCLIEEAYKHDLNLLSRYIIDHKIEWFYLPSSALNNMIDHSDDLMNEPNSIKAILTGAERVKIGNGLSEFLSNHPQIELFNIYGPSETHYVTSLKIDKNKDTLYDQFPHIGKPIPNHNIYILDEAHKPVPIGVTGEICVSGAQLAKGYLNAPESTSKKFIPHPFLQEEVLYKTGDMGRWWPEGTLSFVDRVDDQVKIRGYRVELTEIEAQLNKHSKINQSVVLAPEREEGGRELIAYIIPHEHVNSLELRSYLSESLPYYMIPAYYIELSSIPLTGNDKIDKKALINQSNKWIDGGVPTIEPQTQAEKDLCQIWKDLLHGKNVGLLDNFFDLGGHSLKATQLLYQVHKKFDVKLSIGEIYECTTLKSMVELIENKMCDLYEKIPLVKKADWYDISYAQRRLWILDEFEKDQLAYHMPGAYIMESLDKEILEKAYDLFIHRHEILRTHLITVDGVPKQKIEPAGIAEWKIRYFDLRKEEHRDERVNLLAKQELNSPFNLYKGPLIRATLFQLEENKYIFLLTMHHIVSDGWSLGIIVKEILTLYNEFKQGLESSLPPLAVQYKDYAAWHNQILKGRNLQKLRKYWLDQFSGKLPTLNLPVDHPRPAKKTSNGSRTMINLPPPLAGKIHEFAKQIDASLFVTLVGIVNAFLYAMTQEEDIIIGSPIAGREHPDLENQVGFYVNTLALRTKIVPEDSFHDLLRKVREVIFGAYENRAYPFDQLIDDLNLTRDLSRSPLFDVMVVLQNNDTGLEGNKQLDGVKVQAYPLDFTISKFDLNFSFFEMNEAIYCSLEYNTDLFEKETVQLMTDVFLALTNKIIQQPDVAIGSLDIHGLIGKKAETEENLSFNFS